jgi:HlyD family secretion protein
MLNHAKKILFPLIALVIAGVAYYARVDATGADPNPLPAPAQETAIGVGALGRIEPRSRVVRVSPDAGAAGAVVAKVFVREGQAIEAGQPIAEFSDRARRQAEVCLAQAEVSLATARLRAAEAERKDSQRDYDRKAALLKTGALSAIGVERVELRRNKAIADLEAARASVEQSEASLHLKKLQLLQGAVTAPIDGVVIKIHARAGERVGDEGILEMADLRSLDIVAEVYETDIGRVKVGQKAVVKLSGGDAAFDAEVRELGFMVHKNRVNDTDPLADRDNRIVEVRLTLLGDAVKELQHQLYRQVRVHIEL